METKSYISDAAKAKKRFENDFETLINLAENEPTSTALSEDNDGGEVFARAILSALFSADKLVVTLRQAFLNYAKSLPKRHELLADLVAGEALEWDVSANWMEHRILRIHFLGLLPLARFQSFTDRNFYVPLREFLRDFNREKFCFGDEKVVLVMVRTFTSETDLRRSADNGNFELSPLINVISREFLVDDGPGFMSLFQLAIISESVGTDFYLVPECEFLSFAKRFFCTPKDA